jgi:uncharacterized protein
MSRSDAMPFAAFGGHKYLSLETFRKNSEGVRTPIWFAADPPAGDAQRLYVYTIGNTGKVKRIRNNGRVRIAPCTARGKVIGDWENARAEIVTGAESSRGMSLLNKKYFPFKQLLGFFASFSRRERIVMAILPR